MDRLRSVPILSAMGFVSCKVKRSKLHCYQRPVAQPSRIPPLEKLEVAAHPSPCGKCVFRGGCGSFSKSSANKHGYENLYNNLRVGGGAVGYTAGSNNRRR